LDRRLGPPTWTARDLGPPHVNIVPAFSQRQGGSAVAPASTTRVSGSRNATRKPHAEALLGLPRLDLAPTSICAGNAEPRAVAQAVAFSRASQRPRPCAAHGFSSSRAHAAAERRYGPKITPALRDGTRVATSTPWRFTRFGEPPAGGNPEDEKMELNMQEEACPVALPVVTHRGSRYMVDLRLGQFRELAWPIRVVEFESAEGQELRWNLGIVRARVAGKAMWRSTQAVTTGEFCLRWRVGAANPPLSLLPMRADVRRGSCSMAAYSTARTSGNGLPRAASVRLNYASAVRKMLAASRSRTLVLPPADLAGLRD